MANSNDNAEFKSKLKQMKPLFDVFKDYVDKKGNLSPDAPDKAKQAYEKFKALEVELTTISEPAPKISYNKVNTRL